MHARRTTDRKPWTSLVALMAVLILLMAACGGAEESADAGDSADVAGEGEGAAADGAATPAEDAAEGDDSGAFYAGKELEMIVPFSTGGGTDTQARFMAPFLPEHIPGSPTVGVVNIEGAAGTIGNNQFALQRPHEEATSILFSSGSSFLPWVFQDPALQLDYRDLVALVAVQTGGVAYVSTDTGIESTEQFPDMIDQVDWVAGEQAPNGLGILFLLAYDMLGMDPQAVMGFEGSGPIRVAFEQGELNVNWDSASSIPENVQPMFEAGTAVPVFTVGQIEDGELVEDPVYSDIPTFEEVYEQVHGEEPSGMEWEAYKALVLAGFTLQKVMWLHEDAPDEAVQALREGFASMAQDPEFQEQREEVIGDYDLITGDAVDDAAARLLEFPPELQDWLLDYIVENYNHPDPRQ